MVRLCDRIRLHVFAFYFLPVWPIAWHAGLRSGVYMALAAAGTWFMADYASGHVYSSPGIAGWNALMELAACIIVAGIASVVRTQLHAREKLNTELFEVVAQIKRLEGLLPICPRASRFATTVANGRRWKNISPRIQKRSSVTAFALSAPASRAGAGTLSESVIEDRGIGMMEE